MSGERRIKVVVRILVFLMLLSSLVGASDSLRTVTEMGQRVFSNLGMADTTLGNSRLDTAKVRRCVRDATVEIGTLLPPEKAKTIITASGTFGYLVDKHLDSVTAVVLKRGAFGLQIDVVPFWKFGQAWSQMGSVYDTASYAYCGVWGDSLYPYPIPHRKDTIYVFYTARGRTPTAAADTIDLPHELYTAVEYAATVKGAAILEYANKLEIYKSLLADEIAKFIGGKKPQ